MIIDAPAALLSMVGTRFGPTPSILVSQERINRFAEATDDFQWIHVDTQRADRSPFGTTIAHGYLTLSLFSAFLPHLFEVQNVDMSLNVGLNRVRFISPVLAGSRLSATGEMVSATEKGGGVEVVLLVTIKADDAERPACVLEAIIRYLPD